MHNLYFSKPIKADCLKRLNLTTSHSMKYIGFMFEFSIFHTGLINILSKQKKVCIDFRKEQTTQRKKRKNFVYFYLKKSEVFSDNHIKNNNMAKLKSFRLNGVARIKKTYKIIHCPGT